ncbi:hypothetical protein [Burkholderia sp. LMG 13014]|uniref:hypothetical protein n=1 Tax=Burkholderia sp. LMG 13014 TaxID=2709306 RepID=UPI001963EAD9|nr:hypothetical protein [Burkholderia sp. LMG 13014]
MTETYRSAPLVSRDLIFMVLQDHSRVVAKNEWRNDLHELARSVQWELDYAAVCSASLPSGREVVPRRSAAEVEIARQLLEKGVVKSVLYRLMAETDTGEVADELVENEFVCFQTASKYGPVEVVGYKVRHADRIYAIHPEIDAAGPQWSYVVTCVANGRRLDGVVGATIEETREAAWKHLRIASD